MEERHRLTRCSFEADRLRDENVFLKEEIEQLKSILREQKSQVSKSRAEQIDDQVYSKKIKELRSILGSMSEKIGSLTCERDYLRGMLRDAQARISVGSKAMLHPSTAPAKLRSHIGVQGTDSGEDTSISSSSGCASDLRDIRKRFSNLEDLAKTLNTTIECVSAARSTKELSTPPDLPDSNEVDYFHPSLKEFDTGFSISKPAVDKDELLQSSPILGGRDFAKKNTSVEEPNRKELTSLTVTYSAVPSNNKSDDSADQGVVENEKSEEKHLPKIDPIPDDSYDAFAERLRSRNNTRRNLNLAAVGKMTLTVVMHLRLSTVCYFLLISIRYVLANDIDAGTHETPGEERNESTPVLEFHGIPNVWTEMCEFLEREWHGEEGLQHPRSPLHGDSSVDGCSPFWDGDRRDFEGFRELIESNDFQNFLHIDPLFSEFSKLPSRSECVGGQMTAEGALQHVKLGNYMYQKYAESELFSTDSRLDVTITSSKYNRTLQSAVAFTSAFLYPGEKAVREVFLKASNFTFLCTDPACACDLAPQWRHQYEKEHLSYFLERSPEILRKDAEILRKHIAFSAARDPFQIIDVALGRWLGWPKCDELEYRLPQDLQFSNVVACENYSMPDSKASRKNHFLNFTRSDQELEPGYCPSQRIP
ncbi:unnamed protein product [Nippostrongylus brasiliensis]|uniref:Acid phosphatase-like protein 2 (inferred by orthology to a human protein) n=1 Tax=Nippostrongylus brasiliensis TaxID=27835 RepID=A0A0N4YQU3_NIPBR|nr:unnamed protein product [Nippostrongylus brasiliensis]